MCNMETGLRICMDLPPRGPEDDSVESKHVALLSYYTLYNFSIYYYCV